MAEHLSSDTHTWTVADLLDHSVTRWADRTAIVDAVRRYTYAELQHQARQFGSSLVGLGIRPGDRVALWMPNGAEWVISFFGAVYAGAVVVAINTALSGREAEYQVSQSGARILIAATSYRDRDYRAESRQIAAAVERELLVACVGQPDSTPGVLSWEELNSGGVRHELPALDVSDPVIMLYTSGTTGLPKGAVHSHRFVAMQFTGAARLGITEVDCLVLYLPLFHIMALVAGLLMMTASGARVVLMPRFNPAESLRLIEQERATAIYGIPTTYLDQLGDPAIDTTDLSSVRFALTPLTYDLCLKVRDKFGVVCVNPYGMTETAALVTVAELEDPAEIALGTVGRTIDGMEARIVDPNNGQVLPPGTQGQLSMRGPSILARYHEMPEATAAVLNDDGWFNTGDLASMDEAGNITFVGRQGDSYRVGGEIVDPVEVEAAIQSHPDVIRAAAVGVPDERLGQVGHVWVQTRSGSAVSEDDLRAHARTVLASFKVPRAVHLLDEFPTTPSGKVQKFKLLQSTTQAAG
jgi:fatty-acyl-CoA synthase